MDEEPEMVRGARGAARPASEKERAGYDTDFYTWSQEQDITSRAFEYE
jgi:hypothetical protein